MEDVKESKISKRENLIFNQRRRVRENGCMTILGKKDTFPKPVENSNPQIQKSNKCQCVKGN